MLTLQSREVPTTANAFSRAVTTALQEYLELDSHNDAVRVQGGFPDMDALEIEVTGANIDVDAAPPAPPPPADHARQRLEPGPTARKFHVAANPVFIEGVPLHLDVRASDVAFSIDHDEDDRAILMLASASDGQLHLRTSRNDLERLVLELAGRAAAKHGITITDVAIDIRTKDKRTLELLSQITVRKIVKATVTIGGVVSLGSDLAAKLSNLHCEGSGMIGSLACGFIQPQLARLQGRSVPLTAFSLGQVRVRDIQMHADAQAISVQARFGA